MDRAELAALRDAIDLLLKCPDAVCVQLARWFLPKAAKGNGHDPHPLPIAPASGIAAEPLGSNPPRPIKAKSARRAKPTPAQAAEQRLLAAMADNPGLSVIALANAAGDSRSATGERLRQLAAKGAIEKDSAGHWRLVGEAARPTSAPTS